MPPEPKSAISTDSLIGLDTTLLRNRYKGNGNVINYVAGVLEGYQTGEIEGGYSDALEDIFTAVVEHPLGDAFGQYDYSLSWDMTPDGLKLRADRAYLDDIIERSITNESGQVPQFEIERNKMNREFYEILKVVRSSSDSNIVNSTAVEFSPSPTGVGDDLLETRGYGDKNGCILLYSLDENNEEQITQYWFPKVSMGKYRTLFAELGLPADVNSDLDVMGLSGHFDSTQLETIISFIENNQTVTADAAGKTRDEVSYDMKVSVYEEIIPLIQQTINMLANPYFSEENLEEYLRKIHSEIESLQFFVRLQLREYLNRDTFNSEISHKISEAGLTANEFRRMKRGEQESLLQHIDYVMTACGVGGSRSNSGGSFNLFGKSNSLIGLSNRSYGEGGSLYQSFRCPDRAHCPTTGCSGFYIQEGDVSTYEQNCLSCSADMSC